MGWKKIKAHYRVRHNVKVSDQGVCIGSGRIPDIIIISPKGKIVKRYEDRSNADLTRYQAEMDADPAKLLELLEAEDVFDVSTPVFSFDGGRVIKQKCEVFGWPNATHDGAVMYENALMAATG